jgi:hypothetical protein
MAGFLVVTGGFASGGAFLVGSGGGGEGEGAPRLGYGSSSSIIIWRRSAFGSPPSRATLAGRLDPPPASRLAGTTEPEGPEGTAGRRRYGLPWTTSCTLGGPAVAMMRGAVLKIWLEYWEREEGARGESSCQ